MVCMCDRTWIKGMPVYKDACALLAWKNTDCTIIDVGCGNFPHLHELKRHLLAHDIQCHTVGIDNQQCDIEVDEMIEKDVRDVKMPCTADVVTSSYFFTMLNDGTAFRDVVNACADMLKDDGVMITNRLKHWPLETTLQELEVKIMNKNDAHKHAEQCYGVVFEKCRHGFDISDDMTPDDVRKYLPWLPEWTENS